MPRRNGPEGQQRYRIIATPERQTVLADCPPDCPWLGYRTRSKGVSVAEIQFGNNGTYPIFSPHQSWRERLATSIEAYVPVDIISAALGRWGIQVPWAEVLNTVAGKGGRGYCARYGIRDGCVFEVRRQRVK